jgi:rubrerythrin
MYCPRGGKQLVEAPEGTLVCESGQMELAQELCQRLHDCYILNVRKPQELQFNFNTGGNWFCPSCGVATMEDRNKHIRCPQCDRCLDEFIFALIERHYHAPVDYRL